MHYRSLGKTGLKISEIGCGTTSYAVVSTAIDAGVNVFDICVPHTEIRSHMARGIGSRRKDIVLQGHIGSIKHEGQYTISRDVQKCDLFLKDLLAHLNTDYIDVGIIHIVDTEKDFKEAFESHFIDYIQKLKKEGVIRYIGVSTHNATIGIKMINTGLVDMFMFSINPAFDLSNGMDPDTVLKGTKLDKLQIDPVRAEFYNLCAANGIGLTAMKVLGAGRLLDLKASNLKRSLTLPQCVSYALDRPAVSSVILGARTVKEMEQGIDYFNATAQERDYAAILQGRLPLLNGKCMYCNHCLPCPKKIDVATVTKYLDMAKVSKSETIHAHYSRLSAYASDCIKCKKCEGNCPFSINVVENMQEAVQIFGK